MELSGLSIEPLPGGTGGPRWEQIREVRTIVFLQEQAIPPEEEWDDLDNNPTTIHLAAMLPDGSCIGVARCFADQAGAHPSGIPQPAWRIGRMAVLPAHRAQGVGLFLLRHALTCGQTQIQPGPATLDRALLSAQNHAVPFYARAGFVPFGSEHLDAGIPHRWMQRPLP
jgi:predicted GNAT family N-acyltransferase